MILALQDAAISVTIFERLFSFILWTCVASFIAIVVGKIFFLIRFHRRKRPEHLTPYLTGHTALEMSVAVLLLIWVMVIFYWGWVDYKILKTPPADSLEINIVARQWAWEMQYKQGKILTNELVVPKDKPVKLIMTSQDVLHSFYIPTFRLKQDVNPNTYTSLWFQATEAGEYPIYCAEYCGTAHSGMLGKVRVLEQEDYDDWLLGYADENANKKPNAEKSLADQGHEIFVAKGCQACHSVDGSASVGPTLAKVFGQEVVLAGESKVKVDENYIRQSLMEPSAKLVKGFPPVMPTFKGQLNEQELNALMEYIKSLK